MAFVYLIGNRDNDGAYKIGSTRGKNVEKRIRQLQTGNDGELYLLKSFKTEHPFKIEKMMHRKHSLKRVNGEWFKYRRKGAPQYYQNMYRFAKGGNVRARFIDYQNHINKEQQEATKNQQKRSEVATRKLTQDLDRLSREQMILLRSIFK